MTKEIKDLIAEARECAPGDCSTELAVMVHRLADALEAATRVPVQGEPNEHCCKHPKCPGDSLCCCQGEPNDDREALRDEFRSYLGDEIYVSSRDYSAWAHGTMGMDDFSLAAENDEIIESLVEIASRTTVPDAATLQKAEAKIADLVYGNAKVVAERDAATVAIERVRAIHLEVGRQVDDAGVEYTVCKHCTEVNRYGQVRWPCPTRKALDGKEKNDE